MALSATIVWEVQTGGSATNGGGFNSAASGVDYSQSTSPHATLTTTSVVNATTTKISVNAATYTVAATDIGNIFFLTGGTATAGYYEITAVDTGANTWTMDRAVGTAGQTCPGKMGGCINLPWTHKGSVVSGNVTWIKTGTYTMLANQTFATPGSAPNRLAWVGYGTTRGDGIAATIAAGAWLLTLSGGAQWFESLVFTGLSSFAVSVSGNYTTMYKCAAVQSSGTAGRSAFSISGIGAGVVQCRASSAAGFAFNVLSAGVFAYNSYFHDSTVGVRLINTSITSVNDCIIDTCATGILVAGSQNFLFLQNTTIYNSASIGISAGATAGNSVQALMQFNIIDSCTTGVEWAAMAANVAIADYNNFHNNGTDRVNIVAGAHDTALDPAFADAPNADFRVGQNMIDQANPIAFLGASANCRSYPTKGALQRIPSAGGGGGSFTFTG